MQKIIFNKNNIIKLFNYGIESEVFLYYDNDKVVALKLFNKYFELRSNEDKILNKNQDLLSPITNEILENKRKKLELIYNNDLFKDEVQIKKLVFDKNDNFIGYTMKFENLKTSNNCMKKKYKIEQLKKLKEKIIKLNENGIYYGDFNKKNLLVNKNNIMLCDLDNIRIVDLDFDLKSVHVKEYEKVCKNIKYIDNYCFNLFTISYLYNIYYPYILEYLYQNSLPFRLNTKKNKDIYNKIIRLKNNYNETEFFIDNMKY